MKASLVLVFLLSLSYISLAQNSGKTQNLVIVTLDGFRWQEVFRGADRKLINAKRFNSDRKGLKRKFWSTTAQERRKLLLPFFWSTLANEGQIYGNRDNGSKSEVANPHYFSYPGYNEIFTGFPDAGVNSNDKILNNNTNVLEFINSQADFKNKVAVFTSWDVFPWILNEKRSGLLINSGLENLEISDNKEFGLLNDLQHRSHNIAGDSVRLDALTYQFGKQYMKDYQPRVVYLAFDETDDLAHAGNYKLYLEQANKQDGMLDDLWAFIQSDDFYKNKTTLIITSDHGRGDNVLGSWKNHGFPIRSSKETWFAVIGPDTLPSGEIGQNQTVYQKQLAQTMAKFLGLDFKSNAGHEVGDAIEFVFSNPTFASE